MLFRSRRSPGRVALRPQSPPRSPSQFRRDKNENGTGASASISAAGTSPAVASYPRPTVRGAGGSGLMPRRLTPNSREASPPKRHPLVLLAAGTHAPGLAHQGKRLSCEGPGQRKMRLTSGPGRISGAQRTWTSGRRLPVLYLKGQDLKKSHRR